MKHFRTFGYCVKQGVVGFWKNRTFSIASIATIIACLMLLGVFYFTFININKALSEVENNIGITVFFEDGVTEEDILVIKSQTEKLDGVSFVTYTSAEEAWEAYKNENLSKEVQESFGDDNPLKNSASLEVHLTKINMQTIVAGQISAMEHVRTVNYSAVVVEKMAEIRTIALIVSALLILILATVACFLVRNTITTGINVRKSEISIMSLIGATDFFMILPFVVEGLLIGIIGGIVPMWLLGVLYEKVSVVLTREFATVFSGFSLISKANALNDFVPVAFPFSVGIGVVTSFVTAKLKIRKIAVEHF